MIYEILNAQGDVVNTIDANQSFVEEQYPNRWRIASNQPPESPQPSPVWAWYIDIGPFFDRFGPAKMAVLTSNDAGVQAILKDTQIRKWLDLKLPEVAQSVAYVGSKVPAVTPALQQSILNTPVQDAENLALRKLYFNQ
jgi:hypothetical protein